MGINRKIGRAVHEAKEQRRAQVANMILARMTFRQMQARLEQSLGRKPSLGTIKSDVDALVARWHEEQKPEDRKRWIAQELATLDWLQGQAVSKLATQGNGIIEQAMRVLREAELDEETLAEVRSILSKLLPSHSRWVDSMLGIMDRRSRMLGLEAPHQIQPVLPALRPALPDEQYEKILELYAQGRNHKPLALGVGDGNKEPAPQDENPIDEVR